LPLSQYHTFTPAAAAMRYIVIKRERDKKIKIKPQTSHEAQMKERRDDATVE